MWIVLRTTDITRDTTNTVVAMAPWEAGQIVGTDVSAAGQGGR